MQISARFVNNWHYSVKQRHTLAILPIGLNDGRKRTKKPVPRAAAGYAQQLKFLSKNKFWMLVLFLLSYTAENQ